MEYQSDSKPDAKITITTSLQNTISIYMRGDWTLSIINYLMSENIPKMCFNLQTKFFYLILCYCIYCSHFVCGMPLEEPGDQVIGRFRGFPQALQICHVTIFKSLPIQNHNNHITTHVTPYWLHQLIFTLNYLNSDNKQSLSLDTEDFMACIPTLNKHLLK